MPPLGKRHECPATIALGGGGEGGRGAFKKKNIVSLLARDKRTYHSHNRDFYLRLVAISTYSLYGKN